MFYEHRILFKKLEATNKIPFIIYCWRFCKKYDDNNNN